MRKIHNEMDEYLAQEEMNNLTYYHGTSTALGITDMIEPPLDTNVIREESRKNNRNVVYVTSSLGTATKFAVRAAQKFGGTPVVYEVEPDYDSLNHKVNEEYITNFAKVIKVKLC